MPQINTDAGITEFSGHPNNCPHCHKTITPTFLYGHKNSPSFEVLLICPNLQCNESFLGYYNYDSSTGKWKFNGKVSQGNLIGKSFSENITLISSSFIEIYNQAYSAEQQNLLEICGVGYRKALEFLIKDYLIINKPDDKEKIEKKLLGSCISEYVDDSRIKSVAKRAVWLGNDETHYLKKWQGKNLDDMKKLIELTVHWIEMESLTNSFEDDMPE